MLPIIDLNSNFSKAKRGHISHDLEIVKRSIDMFYIHHLNI